ncbi:MAG: precorrin-8X methylmutase [Ruthenibacterium lactatiformans]
MLAVKRAYGALRLGADAGLRPALVVAVPVGFVNVVESKGASSPRRAADVPAIAAMGRKGGAMRRGHATALYTAVDTGPRPAGLAGPTAGPECGMICPPGRRCMRCSVHGRGYFEWPMTRT